MAKGRLALFRLGIDETDEVDAVLRVLEDLAAHELADVSGSHDHRVLEVGDRPTRDESHSGPAAGNAHDGEGPEENHLFGVAAGVARYDGKRECAGRDQQKDAP